MAIDDRKLNSPYYCDGEGSLNSSSQRSSSKEGPVLSRRQLVAGGLLGAIWWASQKTALADLAVSPDGGTDHTTVVIFLRGGADGLNLLVPFGDDDYYRRRPTLAISGPGGTGSNRALKIDDFFGMHPSMSALHRRILDGDGVCLHAVGSGDQSRSHFEASAAMERGLHRDSNQTSTGWLGRYLASTPSGSAPIRAVALSQTMPDSLVGASNAIAIQSLNQLRLSVPDDRYDQYIAAFTSLYGLDEDEFAESGRNTLKVLKRLQEFDPTENLGPVSSLYPGNSLGSALSDVASLIKAEIGLEFACVNMDGFDTHVTQGTTSGWLPTLLDGLSSAVDSFLNDIGSHSKRTTVIVMTEFGRRISENSGLGTDHGSASCMFVVGGGAKGGRVIADWPGLSERNTDNPGDLNVTTDYRRVLWEVLAGKHAATNPETVFPGFKHSPVGLY